MTRLNRFLLPIGRIGFRDAAAIMRSSTWLGLFLAPLLLALLLLGLVGAVVVLVVALKVLLPEGEDAALGHNQVAVVLLLPAAPDQRARVQTQIDTLVMPALTSDRASIPQEAQLFSRVVRFIQALRDSQSSRASADPAVGQRAPLENTGTPKNETQSQEESTIKFDLFPNGDWEKISLQVPDDYDLALRIEAGEDGSLRYQLRSDAGLLASRVMERRVRDRLIELERQTAESAQPALAQVRVHDEVSTKPDPWLFSALATMAALGFVFMYHSVAAQAVGSVLAGERDQRTLDVLLSLPLTRRQILYGKMLGLLVITAVPAVFWSMVIWLPALYWLGLPTPWGLPGLMLSLQAFLMATGVAVSASSADLPSARNRLGMVNLALLAISGLGLPALLTRKSVLPGSWLLKTVCAGGAEGTLVMWSAAAVLGLATLLILELGLFGFKRLS